MILVLSFHVSWVCGDVGTRIIFTSPPALHTTPCGAATLCFALGHECSKTVHRYDDGTSRGTAVGAETGLQAAKLPIPRRGNRQLPANASYTAEIEAEKQTSKMRTQNLVRGPRAGALELELGAQQGSSWVGGRNEVRTGWPCWTGVKGAQAPCHTPGVADCECTRAAVRKGRNAQGPHRLHYVRACCVRVGRCFAADAAGVESDLTKDVDPASL